MEETTPLSPVRRLRTIATIAMACAAIVWFASQQNWWHDTSKLTGTQLQEALATAPNQAAKDCLTAGGVVINGTCATWDVSHPALGMTTDKTTTIDVTGAAVTNTLTPTEVLGMPSASVFAIGAFLLIAVAAVLRSLVASVASLVFGAQAYKALSALASTINAPVPGIPSMGTTVWFGLFKTTVLLGTLVLGGGMFAWVATERSKERKQRIEDGTHVSFRDRLQAIATAAVTSAATKGAAK